MLRNLLQLEKRMQFLGIQFAPLCVPLERRLQILAVAHYITAFLCMGTVCSILCVITLFTRYWPVVLIYALWMIYDRKTPAQGGRRVHFIRNWSIWRYMANYFPLSLVKTSELDPKNNYLFACHPHGIFSCSHFCNFATEGSGFSETFPNITPHLMVLPAGFRFPIFRDYFLTAGVCSCKKDSLHYLLTKKEGTGQAACVIVGGAVEALEAAPGRHSLVLANKKGFIKSAIQTGAFLVPVYSFGENDLYSQLTSDRARRYQDWITSKIGHSPPMCYGRGLFQYSFGILPYRQPVTTVVGEPIPVKQNEQPSAEEIDHLHSLYIENLQRLFETHKHKYGVTFDQHLIII